MIHFYYLIKEALFLRLQFILLPLVFFSSTTWAQGVQEEWVQRFETQPQGPGVMTTSVIDAEGNIYMTGFSESGQSATKRMITMKYSPTGELRWASEHQGSYNLPEYQEEAKSIAVDEAGSVYVTGLVTWQESAASEVNMATVVKLNAADGSQVWSVAYGKDESLLGIGGIAVDKSGGVYLAADAKGHYRLVKFNAGTGAMQWQQVGGGAGGNDYVSDVKVDDRGGVYVTGNTVERYQSATNPDITLSDYAILTVKYNTSDGSLNWVAKYEENGRFFRGGRRLELDATGVYVLGHNNDMIILKYDLNSGQQRWVTQFRGGTRASEGRDIALDGNGGVYVTGISVDSMPNFATLKLNATSGEIIWSSIYDEAFDQAYAVAVNQQGDVYVSGTSIAPSGIGNIRFITVHYKGADGTQVWVNKRTDVKPASITNVLTDNSGSVYLTGTAYHDNDEDNRNMFVSRMNSSTGAAIWSHKYDVSGAFSNHGTAVAVDAGGNTYVAGMIVGVAGLKYVYAVKYDASGNEVWRTRYADERRAIHRNLIALDNDGGVYVAASTGQLLKLQASDGKQVWRSRAENAQMHVTINAMALDDAGGIYVTGSEAKASIGTSTTSTFLTMKYGGSLRKQTLGKALWREARQ